MNQEEYTIFEHDRNKHLYSFMRPWPIIEASKNNKHQGFFDTIEQAKKVIKRARPNAKIIIKTAGK